MKMNILKAIAVLGLLTSVAQAGVKDAIKADRDSLCTANAQLTSQTDDEAQGIALVKAFCDSHTGAQLSINYPDSNLVSVEKLGDAMTALDSALVSPELNDQHDRWSAFFQVRKNADDLQRDLVKNDINNDSY